MSRLEAVPRQRSVDRGRARGLLDAVVAITGDLRLEAVLSRAVQEAVGLVPAARGVRVVMGPDRPVRHVVAAEGTSAGRGRLLRPGPAKAPYARLLAADV